MTPYTPCSPAHRSLPGAKPKAPCTGCSRIWAFPFSASTIRRSFGTPEDMRRLLHISPGAVSPMGLMFESARDVRLIMDRALLSASQLGCHPCVNTASIRLSMRDFLDIYLPAVHHVPTFVDVADAP